MALTLQRYVFVRVCLVRCAADKRRQSAFSRRLVGGSRHLVGVVGVCQRQTSHTACVCVCVLYVIQIPHKHHTQSAHTTQRL